MIFFEIHSNLGRRELFVQVSFSIFTEKRTVSFWLYVGNHMWKLYFVAIQYIQYVGKFINKALLSHLWLSVERLIFLLLIQQRREGEGIEGLM